MCVMGCLHRPNKIGDFFNPAKYLIQISEHFSDQRFS